MEIRLVGRGDDDDDDDGDDDDYDDDDDDDEDDDDDDDDDDEDEHSYGNSLMNYLFLMSYYLVYQWAIFHSRLYRHAG